MSFFLDLPPLARIAVIDTPELIARLNADPACDRDFARRGGPLLNRLLQARFSRHLRTRRGTLPAFLPRGDAARAEARTILEDRLCAIGVDELSASSGVGELAEWVSGHRPEEEGGPLVQTVIGRTFAPSFSGSPRTWRAAKDLDAFLGAGPLGAAWLRATGRVAGAIDTLARPLGDDPQAVHAVGIAAPTLHRSLAEMRAVMAAPTQRARIDEDRAALRCLRAPPTVPRIATAPLQVPFRARAIPAGTLILFRLSAAAEARLDATTAFGGPGWSRCPAQAFVGTLLRAVWRRAAADRDAPVHRGPRLVHDSDERASA